MKTPQRVGAIMSSTADEVNFFGYGNYVGDEVPPKGRGEFSDALHENGIPNPRIVLDEGGEVWGCECWWGPEDLIAKRIENKKINLIKIETL